MQTSTQNLTYGKISGFSPIIESNGKKVSDFFFDHKLVNFNSKSYLRKISGFNPIIESNPKKESDFFFNHKLHQIENTLPVAKPLCKKMPYQSKNCVIHGYKFTDDCHVDDAFDFSHWDNDDNLIIYPCSPRSKSLSLNIE